MTRRTLALAALAAFLLMACTPKTAPAPAPSTAATVTTAGPEDGPERSVDIAMNDQATIRVRVIDVTERGDLQVVRLDVENIGDRPAETYWLKTEIEDDRGRRFEQETGTTDDIPGSLNPDDAGIVTVRFKLPAGAEPQVVYVTEVAGGEPAPIALP